MVVGASRSTGRVRRAPPDAWGPTSFQGRGMPVACGRRGGVHSWYDDDTWRRRQPRHELSRPRRARHLGCGWHRRRPAARGPATKRGQPPRRAAGREPGLRRRLRVRRRAPGLDQSRAVASSLEEARLNSLEQARASVPLRCGPLHPDGATTRPLRAHEPAASHRLRPAAAPQLDACRGRRGGPGRAATCLR